MSFRKNSEIKEIQGDEGTKIKQYFHPHDTQEAIDYSLAHFTIEPGKKSKLHKIRSCEIYYILEGKGMLQINEKSYEVEKNDSVFVPPNSIQFIENKGKTDLKFLCIVEPAWKAEDEIILE